MKKQLLLFGLLLSNVLQLSAQVHGDLNPNFNGANGTDSYVQVLPNGKVLLGAGIFTSSSEPIILNADGSVDATFDLPFIEQLYPVVIHNSEGIYMFGTAGARYDLTGTYNASNNNYIMNYGLNNDQFAGRVTNAVMLSDGSVVAVGNFDYVYQVAGAFEAKHIFKCNADLSSNATFQNNVTTGFNGEVTAIAYDETSNKIYCGGKFTQYNGTTVNGICRINTDGTIDNTFDAGTGFDAPSQFPTYMKVLSNGNLFISSSNINTFDGVSCNQTLIVNNGAIVLPFGIVHKINDMEEISPEILLVVGETFQKRIQYVNITTGDFLGNQAYDNFQFQLQDDFGIPNTAYPNKIKTVTKGLNNSYFFAGSFTEFNLTTVNNIVEVYLCSNAPDEIISMNGNQLTAIAGDSYNWEAFDLLDENPMTISDPTSQTITISQNGYYTVTVTDGLCIYKKQLVIENLSVNDSELELFSVSPNPTSGDIQLSMLPFNAEIVLLDQMGRTILKTNNDNQEHIQLPLSDLKQGVYYIQVRTENGQNMTQKVIKN